MGVLVFLALFLSFIGSSSAATYCLCLDSASQSAWQRTIDFACGKGADCRPILQNGACFQPNTVKAHCDYAANSYFQNNGQNPQSCVFSNTATTSNNPPSDVVAGCTYPTSAGQATSIGTSTGGTTTTGTPGSTTTGIFSPTGLGPTGMDTTNPNGGSSLLQQWGNFLSLMQAFLISGLLVLWG